MDIISTKEGLFIKQNTLDGYKKLIEKLDNHIKWIEKNNVKPPYIHAIHNDCKNPEKTVKRMEELKESSIIYEQYKKAK